MKGIGIRHFCLMSAAVLVLAACGEKTPPPAAPKVTLTGELQGVYQTNCIVCHGNAGTGAPQTGVAADWQERIAPGMEAMLAKVMDGYQGMPAMGTCYACSEGDFRELIRFMTDGQLK